MEMKKSFLQRYLKWVIIGIALIALPFTVLENAYHFRIVSMAMLYVIVACGLHFITGMVGQISYAQASFYGIGAYTCALLYTRLNLPFFVCLLCAMIVPAILAVIIGYATLKLEGTYMVLGTIGFCMAVQQIILNWDAVTYGAQGVTGIPYAKVFGFSFNTPIRIYFLILGIMLLILLLTRNFMHSRLGRSFLAVNANKQVADVMGIPVTRVKLTAFILSGIYAGIAGALLATYQGYIEADSFGIAESIKHLTMIYIGGLGNLYGVVLGASFLALLPEWLRATGDWYLVIYAFVAIIIIIVYPKGLWGMVQSIASALRRLFRKKPSAQENTDAVAADTEAGRSVNVAPAAEAQENRSENDG
ncbi:MAG: branched-chain amino acid ABC transporter permease [Eubacteriales bacterium]|nr:branched-chain amino acid ABC transporter permease [Eubacteriales bacterium]